MNTAIKARTFPEMHDVILICGDNPYLLHREILHWSQEYHKQFPTAEHITINGSQMLVHDLAQIVSPSLFAQSTLCIIENAEGISAQMIPAVLDLLAPLPPDFCVILGHSGGGNKKNLTDLQALARHKVTIPKITSHKDRNNFVQAEFAQYGVNISADLAAFLLDCVGNDLPNIVSACGQLALDSHITQKPLTREMIHLYFQGKPEITGFEIADKTAEGDVVGALEGLRWALYHGVALVLIADAIAESINTVARLKAQSSGRDPQPQLSIPPWKAKKLAGVARNWSQSHLDQALFIVAQLNRAVKGYHPYPEMALENAIRNLGSLARKEGV